MGNVDGRFKLHVWVLTGNRAESGLLEPVINRLRVEELHRATSSDVDIHVEVIQLVENNHVFTYRTMVDCIKNMSPPDVIIVPCDREEALAAALAVFYSGMTPRPVIVHFEAGYGFTTHTLDDHARFMISMMSHYCLTNTEGSKRFLLDAGFREERVICVGSTAFDDVNIPACRSKSTDAIGDEEFDLVVYHPPTMSLNSIEDDVTRIVKMLDKKTLWMLPNKDRGNETVHSLIRGLVHDMENVMLVEHFERDEFIGHMARATRLIGNSSAFCNEAPFIRGSTWPRGYVHVGDRNLSRERIEFPKRNASDRIVDFLFSLDVEETVADGLAFMGSRPEKEKKLPEGLVMHETAKIVNRKSFNAKLPVIIGDFVLLNAGKHTMLHGHNQISAGTKIVGGGQLEMHEGATIGYNCTIITGTDTVDSVYMNDTYPESDRHVRRGRVVLGRNSFIGSGSVICYTGPGDLVIPDGCVIAANSYIDNKKDLLPYNVRIPVQSATHTERRFES